MCTKCCAYEGASPFVRKCGSAAGARRGGGKPCEEKVWVREELTYDAHDEWKMTRGEE